MTLTAPASSTPPKPSDREVARVAVRVGRGYILRSLQLMSGVVGGGIILGVIFQTIIAANIDHIDQDGAAPYRGVDDTPPDHLRRPISVLALANALGIPYETTRRNVKKLERAGLCVSQKGGVIVPSVVLADARMEEPMLAFVRDLRRFLRQLRAAGVDLD
jgi:hypothetical protein